MTSKWFRVATLSFIAMVAVAGCPSGSDGTGDDDGGDDNGDTTKAITGLWSGTLSCTNTQSLGGAPGTPRTDTVSQSIEFGADGRPLALTVIGFSSDPDSVVAISSTGESATTNTTSGVTSATYVVTVRSATYSSTTARITLDIEYSSVSGAATSEGSGVQTIEAVVNGTTLTYTANVDYDVTLRNASANLTFETGDTTDCTGALTKQ